MKVEAGARLFLGCLTLRLHEAGAFLAQVFEALGRNHVVPRAEPLVELFDLVLPLLELLLELRFVVLVLFENPSCTARGPCRTRPWDRAWAAAGAAGLALGADFAAGAALPEPAGAAGGAFGFLASLALAPDFGGAACGSGNAIASIWESSNLAADECLSLVLPALAG